MPSTAHPQASALVTARLNVGRPDTPIGNRTINYSPLRFPAVNDVVIEPGFIGLGASPYEVVVRFKEALPDDLYHVEILGTGANALRGVDGSAFGDTTADGLDIGVDFDLNFELDLGVQVLAVVPQPITRNSVSNGLQQRRDQIAVYFNNDDLHPTKIITGQATVNPTVVDPAFYQLIFTRDTVQNTDDVVYRPTSIQYDPVTDMALLTFAAPLENLGSGPGTFRLRIGTDEAMPLPPVTVAVDHGQHDQRLQHAGGGGRIVCRETGLCPPGERGNRQTGPGRGGCPAGVRGGSADHGGIEHQCGQCHDGSAVGGCDQQSRGGQSAGHGRDRCRRRFDQYRDHRGGGQRVGSGWPGFEFRFGDEPGHA